MNTKLRTLASTLALMLAAGACSNEGPPVSGHHTGVYLDSNHRVISYEVPDRAMIRDVEVDHGGATDVVRVNLLDSFSDDGAPFALDVHFGAHELAFTRHFRYPVATAFEGARVLDLASGSILGEATVRIDGDTIEMTVPAGLLSGEPTVAVSRWLPASVDLATVSGGLEAATASIWVSDASGPVAGVAPPFAGHISDVRLAARIDIYPTNPGTTNYTPAPPVTLPGGQPATAPPGTTPLPGTGGLMCAWFIIRPTVPSASFLGGCGHDTNGNGVLDAGEIEFYFGYCAFPSASNGAWYDPNTGGLYWLNVNTAPGANEWYLYCTDLATGKLTVIHHTAMGNAQEHCGPPGGWPFFPSLTPPAVAPPGPAPAPEDEIALPIAA